MERHLPSDESSLIILMYILIHPTSFSFLLSFLSKKSYLLRTHDTTNLEHESTSISYASN